MERFNSQNFPVICTLLSKKDRDLRAIIASYGPPPMWTRPNHFSTLILTILEQQVSLASAYAAYKKLKEKIRITPRNLLALTDEELRSCYFSRQKIVYARELANALLSKKISLKKFESMPDEEIRRSLTALKGIGNWTVDVYLMHSLQRTDIFPVGDLALVNAIKMVKKLDAVTRERLVEMSKKWQPYRSVASMIFWHYYIKKKNIVILH